MLNLVVYKNSFKRKKQKVSTQKVFLNFLKYKKKLKF